MNCNHLFLIVFALILIIEASYDYLSEKTEKLPKREKFKFLPEKGGGRFFLYIIYLFPLIITVISPVKEKFNIFDSIKEYMSFYATALTITYTVYTFNKQQEKFLEEKQKEIKERKEAEKKNRELKEKELEDNKDYYRPYFLIEENIDQKKRIILLMKNKSLYLTKVNVITVERYEVDKLSINVKNPTDDTLLSEVPLLGLVDDIHRYETINNKHEIKSGWLITECYSSKFFITAETLKGETILFGYFSPTLKFYKYLKENQDPGFPSKFSKEIYDKNKINNVWGDFNTAINNTPDYLDRLFFEESQTIRECICKDFYNYFDASLKAKSYSDFLKNIFKDIKDAYLSPFTIDINSLFNILKKYIDYIDMIRDDLLVNPQDEKEIKEIEQYFSDKISKSEYLEKSKIESSPYNSAEFWQSLKNYLNYLGKLENYETTHNNLIEILDKLIKIFNIIEVNVPESSFSDLESLWKSKIIYIDHTS